MNENTRNLSRAIEKSKSEITVLFTDIVDSTKFWDKHGDTAGRLMLDRHNTLLFPVVEAFHGTIIKTIGDSIMASFKSPKDALEAAIAMQQRLRSARKRDRRFKVHIRIGIHTGKAIVESNDVFGDTVNVAARVEGAAECDEVLISATAARQLRNRRSRYGLKKNRHFVPKGKRRRMSVWVCDWQHVPNLTDNVRQSKIFPPRKRQRYELALYALLTLASVYLFFQEFIRYLLGDIDFLAKYLFPPHLVIKVAGGLIAFGLIILAVRQFRKLSKPPIVLFRLLKGGGFFGLLFFSSLWFFEAIALDIAPYWKAPYFRADNRFIEVLRDDVSIRRKPSKKSPTIDSADQGDVLILSKMVKKRRQTWAKVVIRHDLYSHGFIRNRLPPRIGVPAARLIERKHLIIRYYHLYALVLAVLGFLFGVWSFRLKPL